MVKTGENVTVTANIGNDGGQDGSYIVNLRINGEIVDAKEVVLAAGESQEVNFTLSGMDYGQYKVEVAELSGEFTASRAVNWWLISAIILCLAAIGTGSWLIKRRIKRSSSEN